MLFRRAGMMKVDNFSCKLLLDIMLLTEIKWKIKASSVCA